MEKNVWDVLFSFIKYLILLKNTPKFSKQISVRYLVLSQFLMHTSTISKIICHHVEFSMKHYKWKYFYKVFIN